MRFDCAKQGSLEKQAVVFIINGEKSMSKIFFLEYMQADFDDLKDSIGKNFTEVEFTVVSGKNVDIKEFIKIKMRGIEHIDFFLLDVRALQNTDYTSILSFKANILEKYPDLSGFFVIARHSSGLSNEEYNDIIRNSVGGKNYIVFNESDNASLSNHMLNCMKNIISDEKTETIDIEDLVREKSKISDNESISAMKRNHNKHLNTKKNIEVEELLSEECSKVEMKENTKKEIGNEIRKEDFSLNASDLLVVEEAADYNKKGNYVFEDINRKLIWHSFGNIIILFGVSRTIGTSFVSMSLALELKNTGAKVSYVQFDPIADLDYQAKDFGFTYNGNDYEYQALVLTKNKFLKDMNCYVIDIGNNLKYLNRAFELGWLDKGKLILVSTGNYKGLKRLDETIEEIKHLQIKPDIVLINSILDKEAYSKYEQDLLYFFEFMKHIDDKKNKYMLSLIADKLNKDFERSV